MTKPVFTTLEELRQWYFRQGIAKYRIFHGFISRFGGSINHFTAYTDDGKTIDDAWGEIETDLDAACAHGGRVTLFVPGASAYAHYSAIRHAQQNGSTQNPGIAGIHGQDVGSYVQKQVEAAVEKNELKHQIARLEEMIEGATAPKIQDQVVEKLLSRADGILDVVLTHFRRPASIQQPVHGIPDQPQGEQQQDGFVYDTDTVVQSLDTIRETLPDVDIHQLLQSLAGFVKEKPTMARNVITTITQTPDYEQE